MTKDDNARNDSSKLRTALAVAAGVFGGVVAVLGVVFIVPGYIDSRVDERIRSSEVRAEIAKESNKYLVFDGRGIVVNDPNGIFDEWVDSIVIEKMKEPEASGTDNSVVVTIRFKKLVEIEPLLFNYGDSTRTIGSRVSSLEWKFYQISVIVAGPNMPQRDSVDAKFLLQLFR